MDSLARLKKLLEMSGCTFKQLEEKTDVSRRTWSRVFDGKSPLRQWYFTVLGSFAKNRETEQLGGVREPWQRLPFAPPRCRKCGARMQRVDRKIDDGKTFYAWRCAAGRSKSCDSPRIWTDDRGAQIQRPSHRIKPTKNLGVSRPLCEVCGRDMASIGRDKGHPIFGSLWKWRCVGTTVKPHKAREIVTDYDGRKIQLPHIRSWGWDLLPFERTRLQEMLAKDRIQRWVEVVEKCSKCEEPLKADKRGTKRWRLHCSRCLISYFVDVKGRRVETLRAAVPRQSLPKGARVCPQCGNFLTLTGTKWHGRRSTPHSANVVRLVCVKGGRRHHRPATFYFDLAKKKFLSPASMQPGQRLRECPVRMRCCGRPMWASHCSASKIEPEHWFLTCANPSCSRGRSRKRKYLKVGLDGKQLPWLKGPMLPAQFSIPIPLKESGLS
jgi:hypothetical protein